MILPGQALAVRTKAFLPPAQTNYHWGAVPRGLHAKGASSHRTPRPAAAQNYRGFRKIAVSGSEHPIARMARLASRCTSLADPHPGEGRCLAPEAAHPRKESVTRPETAPCPLRSEERVSVHAKEQAPPLNKARAALGSVIRSLSTIFASFTITVVPRPPRTADKGMSNGLRGVREL